MGGTDAVEAPEETRRAARSAQAPGPTEAAATAQGPTSAEGATPPEASCATRV